ncbi:MAG TPA: hypothetical protein P5102_19280, partial [Candidatus Competibacteraceae bacterium]|nr:hypothetical protein [Candidatus Competibacteraceae bacterium]
FPFTCLPHRSDHRKIYRRVEFEVVSEGKYAQAIAQFRQLHYTPDFIRLIESKTAENGNGHNGK